MTDLSDDAPKEVLFDMGISRRLLNCLVRADRWRTIGDIRYTPDLELRREPQLGRFTIAELRSLYSLRGCPWCGPQLVGAVLLGSSCTAGPWRQLRHLNGGSSMARGQMIRGGPTRAPTARTVVWDTAVAPEGETTRRPRPRGR